MLNDGTTNLVYGLARLTSGTGTWYQHDGLGSVRAVLDGVGAVQSTTSYDPWGTPQTALADSFGFTGELQFGEQVHLRARWYNTNHGRFMARDAWPGTSTRPASLHGYLYTANNPVNRIDPSGYDWLMNWSLVRRLKDDIITIARFHERPADLFSWEIVAILMATHIAREQRQQLGLYNWAGDVIGDRVGRDNISTGIANLRPKVAVEIINGDIGVEEEPPDFGKYPLATLCPEGPMDETDYPILKQLLRDELIALDFLGANIARGIDRVKAVQLRPSVFNVGNWLWNGVPEPPAFWRGIANGRAIDDDTTDDKGAGYAHGLAMVQHFSAVAIALDLGSTGVPVNLYNQTADPRTDESVFVHCQVQPDIEPHTMEMVVTQEANCGPPLMFWWQFWDRYQPYLEAADVQPRE